MFSEVIKLLPQLDRSRLSSMVNDLNQRFGGVAKKFGAGMKNALKFGALGGIAAGFLAKILNPLQKAEEVIDRILNKGDDAMTNAEEFQTDPGKLLRLEALGQAKGVNSETMRMLLGKFQSALSKEQEIVRAPKEIQKRLDLATDPAKVKALEQSIAQETDPEKQKTLRSQLQQAKQDTGPQQIEALQIQLKAAKEEVTKGGALREFVGETDMAEAFFKFIQSMQGLEKSRQVVVQGEIFGEKVRGKASEFFNAKPEELASILKELPTAEALAAAAARAGDLADAKDRTVAVNDSRDFVTKAGLVNEGQINSIEQRRLAEQQQENRDLQTFTTLKNTANAIDELTKKFENLLKDLAVNVLPELVKGVRALSEILPSAKKTKDAVVGAVSSAEDFAAPYFNYAERLINDPHDTLSKDPVVGPLVQYLDKREAAWDEQNRLQEQQRDAFMKRIEGIWAEFTGSRFFKFFGIGRQ